MTQLNRRHIIVGTVALCAAHALPAFAHKEKTTVTTVVWDAQSKLLLVTHNFHINEAETALYKAGITDAPKFESLRARAQLALYTQAQFGLQTLDKHEIALETLGAEIEGRDAFVYQQAKLSQAPKGLLINCALLRPLIPHQINHVDVNLAGEVRSLAFRGTDGIKKALA